MEKPLNYDEDVAPGPHELRVEEYCPQWQAHRCLLVGTTRKVLVDLLVAGDIPSELTAEDLIGKTVRVDYTHGFVWIGSNPRIVETAEVTS